MIKAVFFDMAGVIFTDTFKQSLDEYGKELGLPAGKMYEVIHDHEGWKDFTLGNITEDEYLSMCEKRAGVFSFDRRKFVKYIDKSMVQNPAVIDFVKQLSSAYTVGVITNNPKEWFERFLKRAWLKDTIKVRAVSSYIHVRKPDKKIFEYALRQAGVKGEEAVYVDDRPDRVQGAHELGINVVVFDGDVKRLKDKINNL